MMKLFCRAVLIAALVLQAAPAFADLTGVAGGIVVILPPQSVVVGALDNDTEMFLFAERTTYELTAPVSVDITLPGSVDLLGATTPGVIPTGAIVDSHYLHHKGVGSSQNFNEGTISFDTDVLGLVILTPSLVNSNAELGALGTTYIAASAAQGYELTGQCGTGAGFQDRITLSPDRRTVAVCTNTYGAPDDVRIVTRGRIPAVIDIKPGSFPNSINTQNNGVIPVALLGDNGLDLSLVSIDTIRFAGASPSHVASEDVNGDGIPDIIMQFVTSETNLKPGDTMACLKGEMIDGQPFKGCDSVRIVK